MISSKKVCFIGGGSMAEAIIAGLISNKSIQTKNISVINKSNQERLNNLKNKYNIDVSSNKENAIGTADIIILAVKPKNAEESLNEISNYINSKQIIISVVAGLTTNYISKYLNDYNGPIIRTMPNTSSMIGLSATGMSKGKNATTEDLNIAKKVLEAVGTVSLVEESQLNAVTGLSGSGPAYFYYFVEAMEDAAIQLGLDSKTARDLVVQTILGAGHMLNETSEEPSNLRKKVTSPNGTTMAGIDTMQDAGVYEAIVQGVFSATTRAKELGETEK